MIKTLTIIFIVIVAACFRFYNFVSLFHWTMDEEYWSYIPQNIATGYHFPLIGGSIAGTGLYTGPLFVYLMAIPAFVFSGSPLGFGITVATLGILGAVLIFVLGKHMFSSKVAFLAAFLYSASFLMAIFDRHYWNASLTPFLSLLVLFFVFKKSYIPLALVLAVAFHAHGTGIALMIFSAASLLLLRVNLLDKKLILGVLLFIILQVPLVAFDLRHNFLNTRAALQNISKPKSANYRPQSVVPSFLSTSSRLIYFPSNDLNLEQTLCPFYQKTPALPVVSVVIILLILIGAFLSFKKNNQAGKLSFLLIVATLVSLLFFKDKISEYYFSPTFVPIFFLAALALSNLGKKPLVILLTLYFALNLTNLLTAKRAYPFDAKLDAVTKSLTEVGNEPFSLTVTSSDPCQIYGFRYLYSFTRHEPASSYMDSYFLWFYEHKIPKDKPVKHVHFNLDHGQIIQSVSP